MGLPKSVSNGIGGTPPPNPIKTGGNKGLPKSVSKPL